MFTLVAMKVWCSMTIALMMSSSMFMMVARDDGCDRDGDDSGVGMRRTAQPWH